jgi:hypothetical protein
VEIPIGYAESFLLRFVCYFQVKCLSVTLGFPFYKAGVDICSVPAAYLVPQPPTAPQERNFTPLLESSVNLTG